MKWPGRSGVALETGWILAGRCPDGAPVRFVFGTSELRARPGGLTIGRHPALSERVLDEPSVSRRHARLALDGGVLVVEDLSSLNGTLIDDRPLAPFAPRVLAAGQTLSLGAVDLEVEALAEDEAGA
ncbi:MAG TPA: FHA domain-containing protein [Geminicoccaceae bacterium]